LEDYAGGAKTVCGVYDFEVLNDVPKIRRIFQIAVLDTLSLGRVVAHARLSHRHRGKLWRSATFRTGWNRWSRFSDRGRPSARDPCHPAATAGAPPPVPKDVKTKVELAMRQSQPRRAVNNDDWCLCF